MHYIINMLPINLCRGLMYSRFGLAADYILFDWEQDKEVANVHYDGITELLNSIEKGRRIVRDFKIIKGSVEILEQEQFASAVLNRMGYSVLDMDKQEAKAKEYVSILKVIKKGETVSEKERKDLEGFLIALSDYSSEEYNYIINGLPSQTDRLYERFGFAF